MKEVTKYKLFNGIRYLGDAFFYPFFSLYLKSQDLVEDKKIIYTVIVFEQGRKHYLRKDYIYGPVLSKTRKTLFKKYLERELLTKQTILKVMPNKYIKRRLVLKNEIKSIEKILKDFEK